MAYSRLFLLVEGPDDARFVQRILIPKLRTRYDLVQVYEYSQKKAEKVDAFLRSIHSMGADYFLFGDLNAHPCFPSKRDALAAAFKNLNKDRAIIVVMEIESWYLAGLGGRNPLRVRVPEDTSHVTKEQFHRGKLARFDSRVDYMIEMLKHFNVETGARQNASLRYFLQRCGLLSG